MTTIPHEPVEAGAERRHWSSLLVPELWACLAIAVMWLSVVFTAVYGPNIVNTTPGGSSSSVPSAIVVALFAFLGTWVVARRGFGRNGRP